MAGTLGSKIKYYRKQKGYTQDMLAEKTELSKMSIRRYETGERQPRVEQLKKIANALEVSILEFMEDYETQRICKQLGKKVQNLRKSQGLTQNELAKLADTDVAIIQCCENGSNVIELEILKRIFITLGSSLVGSVEDWSIYPNRPTDPKWYAGDYSEFIKAGERMQKKKENILLNDYRKLNEIGQLEARKRVNELTEIKKYTEIEDEYYE